jgi:hypothetical protein
MVTRAKDAHHMLRIVINNLIVLIIISPAMAQTPTLTPLPEDCDPAVALPSLMDVGAPAAAFGAPVDLLAQSTPDPSCLEGIGPIALLDGEAALNTAAGVLKVTYPYLWLAAEDQVTDSGLLLFANAESVLDKPLEGNIVPAFESGEELIAVGVLPLEALVPVERPATAPLVAAPPQADTADAPDPVALVEVFGSQFIDANGMRMIGAPMTATFGDHTGAFAFYAGEGADVLVVLVALDTPSEPVYALFVGISAPGESLDVEVAAFEMARTLTFTTPELAVTP